MDSVQELRKQNTIMTNAQMQQEEAEQQNLNQMFRREEAADSVLHSSVRADSAQSAETEKQSRKRQIAQYQPVSYTESLAVRGLQEFDGLPEERKRQAKEKAERAGKLGDRLRSDSVKENLAEMDEFYRENGAEELGMDYRSEIEKSVEKIDHAAKEAYASTLYFEKAKKEAEDALAGIGDGEMRRYAETFLEKISLSVANMEGFLEEFYQKREAEASGNGFSGAEDVYDAVHEAMAMSLMAGEAEEWAAEARIYYGRCCSYLAEAVKIPADKEFLKTLAEKVSEEGNAPKFEERPAGYQEGGASSRSAVMEQMEKYCSYAGKLTYYMLHMEADGSAEEFGDPDYQMQEIHELYEADWNELQKDRAGYATWKALKEKRQQLNELESREAAEQEIGREEYSRAEELREEIRSLSVRMLGESEGLYEKEEDRGRDANLSRMRRPVNYKGTETHDNEIFALMQEHRSVKAAEKAEKEERRRAAREAAERITAEQREILAEQERLDAELAQYEERMSGYEQRIRERQEGGEAGAARVALSKNIRATAIRNELATYVPENAAGKMDDYMVDGNRVKGVSKVTARFEGWFGGVKSSKLDERISVHVKRSLLSRDFSEKDYLRLSAKVVEAGGLLQHKMFRGENEGETGYFYDTRLDAMPELRRAMRILSDFQRMGMSSAIDTWDKIKEYGGNEEICEYLTAEEWEGNENKKKAIAMYFASRKIRDEFIKENPDSFSAKEKKEFLDRITAICNNLQIVAGAITSDEDFMSYLRSGKRASLEEQRAANMARFRETQRRMAEITPDLTIVDMPGKALKDCLEIHKRSLRKQKGLNTVKRRVNRDRLALYTDEELTRAGLEGMLQKDASEAEEATVRDFEKKCEQMIMKGLKGNGESVQNWKLPRYRDLFRHYMTANGYRDRMQGEGLEPVREAFIEEANRQLVENIFYAESYLDELQAQGGKYKMLSVPEMRTLAVDGIIEYLGDEAFKEKLLPDLIDMITERKDEITPINGILREYQKKYAHIRCHFMLHPGLMEYYDEITARPENMRMFFRGRDGDIYDMLSGIKKNVDECVKVVEHICREKKAENPAVNVSELKSRLCALSDLKSLFVAGQTEGVEELVRQSLEYMDLLHTAGERQLSREYKEKTSAVRRQEMLSVILGETGLQRLSGESGFLLEEIEKDIQRTSPGGAGSLELFERLSISKRTKYLQSVRKKLQPVIRIAGETPEIAEIITAERLTLLQSLIRKSLSGELSGIFAMRKIVNPEIMKREKMQDVQDKRDIIMSLGDNWESKRIVVDYMSMEISRFTRSQVRSVARSERIQNMADRASLFGEDAPVSFYEYAAEREAEQKPVETMLKEWKAEMKRWAGKDEARKKFVKDATKNWENGYGLEKYLPIIVNALGDRINSLEHDPYSRLLQKIGLGIVKRRNYLHRAFERYHIPVEERGSLEGNLESHFADARYLAEQKEKELGSAEAAEEALEKEYQECVEKALGAFSRFFDKSTAEQGKEQHKLRMYVERKDERLRRLARRDNGIMEPLIPFLIANTDELDKILCLDDQEYALYTEEMLHRITPVMKMLTEPKSVYYAMIDQCLLKFHDRILLDETFDEAEAGKQFDAYYKEILHFAISDKMTLSDAMERRKKEMRDSEGNKLPEAEAGNIVMLVLLYEGIQAVLSKDKVQAYTNRYLANKPILDEVMNRFLENPEQEAAALKYFDVKEEDKERRTAALKEAFRVGMVMEEREYLLAFEPDKYREIVENRVRTMFQISAAYRVATDEAIEVSESIKQYSQENIAERKKAGREILESERKEFAACRELAGKGISPLEIAKKSGVTAEVREQFIRDNHLDIRKDADRLLLMLKEYDSSVNISDYRETAEGLMNEKKLLPPDGFLNDYASGVIIRALYHIFAGQDIRKELEEAYTQLHFRKEFVDMLDYVLDRSKIAENPVEKLKLRKGFYEYYAPEFIKPNVKLVDLSERLADWVMQSKDKLELEYMADDRGAYYAVGSGADAFLQTDPEALEKGNALMKRLAASGNETAKKIAEMDAEDRTYFFMLLNSSGELNMAEEEDVSAMDLRELAGFKKRDIALGDLRDTYQNETPILSIPDYEKAEALLFKGESSNARAFLNGLNIPGLEMQDRSLDRKKMKKAFALFQTDYVRKLKENRERNLSLLNQMAEETQDVMELEGKKGRDAEKRPSLEKVSTRESFLKELKVMAKRDITGVSGLKEGKQMIDALEKLSDVKLHMLLIFLSDRNVLDSTFIPGESGVVDQKKRDRLMRLKESGVGRMLADEPAGTYLYRKALSNLCSYQIRDDRSIKEGISKRNLVERNTRVDFELLRKALESIA